MYVTSQLTESNLLFSHLSFNGNSGRTIGRYVFIEEREDVFVPSVTWDSLIENATEVECTFVLADPQTELPQLIDLVEKSYTLRTYQIVLLIILAAFNTLFFLSSSCLFCSGACMSLGTDLTLMMMNPLV